jgi:phosphoribosylglycinamide formyltransferase-1
MTAPLKAAVLISGSGSNLQAIIDHIQSHAVPCDIQVVVSNNPAAYGLARAQRAGIATAIIDHEDFQDRKTYDQKLRHVLDEYQVQVVLLAGFMRILSDEFVEAYTGRMLNIHPSLLPSLKGLHTHRRAIEEGREFHGATVHFVIPALDSGPIVIRGRLRLGENPTVEELEQRVHELEYRIYPKAVEWLARGRLRLSGDTVYLDDKPLPPEGYEIYDAEL